MSISYAKLISLNLCILNKIYKNVEDLIKILSSDFKNNSDQIKQIIQNNIELQEHIINIIAME